MRHSITFWLNDSSDTDSWLLDVIHALKADRQFSKVIRDGIRLIVALRSGQTDVLFEMFPWVQYHQVPMPPPPVYKLPPSTEGDFLDLVDKMIDEELKKLVS